MRDVFATREPATPPTAPSEAWLFAQALLGRSIPGPTAAAAEERRKREILDWLADISPGHDRQRRAQLTAQAEAVAKRRQLEWLAQITTRHERELRHLLAAEAAEQQTTARIERFIKSLAVQEADWDPAKHPRRGTPPNPGWFAPKGTGTTSLTAKADSPSDREAKSANQDEPPPEMLELAGAWWETNSVLQQYRDEIKELPRRIASYRRNARGGRHADIYRRQLAKAELELETARALVPELEMQLRELQQKYHDAGYDDVPYGVWRADETPVGGVGIAAVGRAVHSRGGSMIGPQSMGIEFDIALGAGALRQLAKQRCGRR